MPDFTVTDSAGKKYKIPGPEGATQEQAQQYFQKQHPDLYSPQRDFSGNEIPPSSKPAMPKEALDPTLGTEFMRGAAGDVYGAGQVAGHILPKTITDPISASRYGQDLKRFATAPTQGGIAGKAARLAGGAAPFLVQPELGLGAIGDAAVLGGVAGGVQPTRSGSLPSHLGGAAVGAATGGLGGAFAGTEAQQAMRAAGVNITPGRMFGAVGRGWEHLASRLPVLNRLIGHGRQVSLDDFQRALYQDALEPLRGVGATNAPTAVGSAGLDQLRTIITDRLNTVLARSTFNDVAGFSRDLAPIIGNARRTMSNDTLQRFQTIIEQDIGGPLGRNGGVLPGSRLAGRYGIVATLGSTARTLWRSSDTQDRVLASALDRVQQALLDNASIGGGGRAELDAARAAYARYITLSRAGSGATREGFIDSESLLGRLRRENEDVFARGQMRLQPFAQQARRAGVPRVGETQPEVGATHSLLAGLFHGPALVAAPPSLLYNRPAMSIMSAAADQARRLGTAAGTAAGQTDIGSWLSSQFGER